MKEVWSVYECVRERERDRERELCYEFFEQFQVLFVVFPNILLVSHFISIDNKTNKELAFDSKKFKNRGFPCFLKQFIIYL